MPLRFLGGSPTVGVEDKSRIGSTAVQKKILQWRASPIDARAHRALTIRLLRISMVAALVLPTLLFSVASWISYRDTFALADERIERSLEVAQEQALKVLQSVSLSFVAVQNLLDGQSDAQIREHSAELRDRMKAIAGTLPEVQSISVLGADGQLLASTSETAAPDNFAQEQYFRLQRDGFRGTYLGHLHEPQFGGGPFFPISLARRSGGTFLGIIEISVLPSDFGRFYSRIVTGPGLQYGLIRQDGTMLARYPPSTSELNLDENSGFGRTIAANPEGGFYTVDSQVDHINRRFGVRRIPGYPLYISAGIETAAIRWEWLSGMALHLIFGIPATFFLFLSLLIVLRRTNRLHAEQDRREAAEATMRQAQKMDAVGRLTGGVAHDFNNLLMIIIGNLEIMQRAIEQGTDGARAKLNRSIENAMLGARRAAALTQRLLAFSRQSPLNPRPLDFNRLLSGLSDFLVRSLGETISLEVVGSAGLWTAEADQPQLEAAIINLAVNARDAMPDGGNLTIETSNAYLDDAYCRDNPDITPGQYVVLAVSDTGSGMESDVIDRAVEPFFTTKPAGQGTGLGLSQVYGFVKQSGGHLKIYSERGQGTTVKIYLPRALREAAIAETVESPATGDAMGDRECIMVVEDDDNVRTYVVETLRGLNYRVDDAASGDEALKLANDSKFDLLLTDVVLPGINGRELAEKLKTQQPGIKVVFMTGYSRNAIVHNGRLDPGVELIQKPVTGRELAMKIREVLRSREIAAATIK
jgi:signal transduction histidine kinase/CheY-like chemotaxis protein